MRRTMLKSKIHRATLTECFLEYEGSIAIDGISLTVARVTADSFAVSVIPHTAGETILLEHRPGDRVNLECDIVAKYVERLMGGRTSGGGVTEALLAENGFL